MQMALVTRTGWPLKLLALLIGVGTALAALTTFAIALSPVGIESTIEHSRQILKSFQEADRQIIVYRRRTGKFPDPSAMDRLHEQMGRESYLVTIIEPQLNDYRQCCKEAVDILGDPPKGSYLLQIWRGDWAEYYAPWSGKSTLTFKPGDYSITGSLYLDAALAALITLAMAYAARRFWIAGSTRDC